jgi:eukaryotic-like serine/threonine-protein kinase
MNSDRTQEQSLLQAALALESEAQREAFLNAACAKHPDLRRRIDELIAASGDAEAFFQKPPEKLAGLAASATDPTVRLERPADEAPGERIGRYKLLQVIGEGGMGVVYMAEQEEPVRRRVALKIIKLGMDTRQVVARFEAERQALAMMDHPNIARVLDGGATETGRPYFVMELVQGVPITEFCDKNKLPAKERMRLFVQVCQAIQSAHQKGIIHRDIKPSNVLVTLHHGEPMPKVIDFGIAKATNQKLTEKTLFTNYATMIGTPAYMSPEQAEMTSMDVDTRTDVYSLGVLLYELLTGSTPFPDKRLRSLGYGEMQRVIVDEEPERPSTRLSTMANEQKTVVAKNRGEELAALSKLLRGDLDWVVMRCLEKDRRRRYDTPNELVADIERHLKNEPVVARPPTVIYRFQKMVKRNKLAFAAVTSVAAVLVLGVVVSTWQAVRAMRAEREQNRQREAAVKASASEAVQRRTAVEQRTKAEAAQASEAKQHRTTEALLYGTRMNLAQEAWEQDNIAWLRQLLLETQDSPYRGFEWYYWQRQCHQSLHTLRGFLGNVNSAVFSPDGQRILTGSDDKLAKLWDAATGRELFTLKGHRAEIKSVAFSPDGQRIVTGSEDQTAKVWDAVTRRELRTLRGHRALIGSVAFSPDGQRIVTGSDDRTAKVWEAASGRELLTLDTHGNVFYVAFSPDGRRIATANWTTARVWEAATGRELLKLEGGGAEYRCLAFSPDSQRIVTGGFKQAAQVWDVANGRKLTTLAGHRGTMRSVAFSPDGERILTGSEDQTAKVWDAVSGQELFTLKGHTAGLLSVGFSPDGQRIVTGSWDHTAKVWDAANARVSVPFKGHTRWISSLAFSQDRQRIVTGSWDKTAKVWDTASGRELLTLTGHNAEMDSIAFSPDGQRIVTGSPDQTIKVWDAVTGTNLFTLKGHSPVAFSPDGRHIAANSNNDTVRVWDAAGHQELLVLEGHRSWVLAVAFSPDGRKIVTGSDDDTAMVWDAASGERLLTLKDHHGEVVFVAFSPDGLRIVTGSADQTAKVWDAASGQVLLTLKGHSAGIGAAAFSPDGLRIVTGCADHTARVWDAVSGGELLVLKGHSQGVNVAFSADGQRIVTASLDETVRQWEAARAAQVAVWQEEERATEESLVVLKRQQKAELENQRLARSGDEGAVKQWLILAPIALAPGQSGAEALDKEQIEDEGHLQPKPGERRLIGNEELKWHEVTLKQRLPTGASYVIDFKEILQQQVPQSAAYAVCYIRSEVEQHELHMLVSTDNPVKVYLNGEPIYKFAFHRSFFEDQDTVPDITLNAGLNVLVYKSVSETDDWKASIRFTDAQGNPVNGIKVTLTP